MTFEEQMGTAIRVVRHKERGLTLRDFATRLSEFGLPLSHSALSRIERGERGVEVRELLVIAAALDVSPDVLAFYEDKDNPEPRALVPLSDVLVERADILRSWWSGRSALLGALRRRPRPTWPFPEEHTPDRLRDRHDAWRALRPAVERRAYEDDAVARLAGAVDRLVKAAGRRPKPNAQDRAAMVDAAHEAWRALSDVTSRLPPGSVALHREAGDKMHASMQRWLRDIERAEGRRP